MPLEWICAGSAYEVSRQTAPSKILDMEFAHCRMRKRFPGIQPCWTSKKHSLRGFQGRQEQIGMPFVFTICGKYYASADMAPRRSEVQGYQSSMTIALDGQVIGTQIMRLRCHKMCHSVCTYVLHRGVKNFLVPLPAIKID